MGKLTAPNGAKGEAKKVVISRVGRDEMNLAEYAFASLRNEPQLDSPVTERKWMIRDPHYPDREIEASWRVAGDPKLGRPTATDVKVYLALMEMTRDQKWSQDVSFSTKELVEKLGWPVNAKHYSMIRASLRRLKAVNITARNCFWDNQGRILKGETGFSILDNYHVDETMGRKGTNEQLSLVNLSWIRWNTVIHTSMKADYVRPLDLDLAFSLERAVSMALFRYLDKKRYAGNGKKKPVFSVGLRKLCETHLQLSDTRYVSTMKRVLAPAHEELIAKGFLVSASYEEMTTQPGERVIYCFSKTVAKPALPKKAAPPQGEQPESVEDEIERIRRESEWRERLMGSVLSRIVADDPDDYKRLYDDSVSNLGEMSKERFAKNPNDAAVARTIREDMFCIIEIEYAWMIEEVAAQLREAEGDE